ncbi:MAG: hypothetical protein ACTSRU_05720 [Candidatus Hodarchaeales archaeon]
MDSNNPAEPAHVAITKIKETLESFLKESSMRAKDLEQGLRIAEEMFDGAAKNIEQRQIQISNQKDEIRQLEEGIASNEKTKSSLEESVSKNISAIESLKSTIEKQKEEINQSTNRINELNASIKSLEEKASTLKSNIEKTKKEIDSIKTEGDKKIEEMLEENRTHEEEIKQLKKENSVLDFLIEESSVEIPEVDVLTAIIASKTGKISVDSLKQEMGLPPITVKMTVQKLDAKGIITFTTDNEITLK